MIPLVHIVRLEELGRGTLGVLRINGIVQCWTLELPDRLNVTDRSSIPAQQYVCIRHNSPKFGMTFLVSDVPARSAILFHSGNTKQDSRGCVMLGNGINDEGITHSRDAFKAFMQMMHGYEEFWLSILEVY